MKNRTAGTIVAAAGILAGACGGNGKRSSTVTLWALGREGEVVRELVPEFERRHPGARVIAQQIPWTAAHEKLLTAFVGGSAPDVAQLGNTWIPEFAAIGAIEPLDGWIGRSRALAPGDYFEGIWKTNLFEGATYGVPWYVDTRVLFYRRDLLAQAGYPEAPRTWDRWRDAMRKIRGPDRYAILLPTNEWEQLVIFGLEKGAGFLRDRDTRGAFEDPAFASAADFYVGLYRDALAPVVSYTQIGNAYQEFARGFVAMWITGPWNLGNFRQRFPPEFENRWMTVPLPAPDAASPWPGMSLAGGSSLALFRASKHKDLAWQLLEFLSEPAIQARFYALSGDLPPRRAAWDDPAFSRDVKVRAFREQLGSVAPMPRVPEWEQIAQKIAERMEPAIRGRETNARVLGALDADVDRILDKRRWLLARRTTGAP